MVEPVLVLIGVGVGAGVLWVWARLRERVRTAELREELSGRLAAAEAKAESAHHARMEAEAGRAMLQNRAAELERALAVAQEREIKAREYLAEQRAFVEASKKDLETSFQALAATALKSNNEQFLAFAEQKLGVARTQAAADLDERKAGIEALLAPLRETLGKLETKTGEIETARVSAYAQLEQRVAELSRSTNLLNEKTTTLATALKATRSKGRWGEIALRNIAELAGMTEHCDFEEQETQVGGGRPDMVVRLPGERRLAVDAKVPLDAFLEAADADTPSSRAAALKRHVEAVRGHVRALASRAYADALGGGIDLVVLFVPGDPILAAAFEQAPELQIEALREKVLVATPTTLVALLRTVAIYWQQRSMAENAQAIADTARTLYERAAKFGEDLGRVGSSLKSATEAYNRAVGAFEGRFLPMGRRLEEMKVTEQVKRQLKGPPAVEVTPRESRA